MKKAIVSVIALTVLLGACSSGGDNSQQGKSQATTDNYTEAATKAVPYPLEEMKASGWLERKNLKERLLRYSKSNKISYIYLFSSQGQLISNYTIKGKVSNASSQLTTSQIVHDYCGSGCEDNVATDAPMDDGTWGPSEDAIFFFTTENVMVQWNGPYVLSDAPLNLTSAPVLVYDKSSKPTSTAGG